MERTHSHSTSNYVIWHRKQGPIIKTPVENFINPAMDVSLILVGRFIDCREFSLRHIQEWVDTRITKGRITDLLSPKKRSYFSFTLENSKIELIYWVFMEQ